MNYTVKYLFPFIFQWTLKPITLAKKTALCSSYHVLNSNGLLHRLRFPRKINAVEYVFFFSVNDYTKIAEQKLLKPLLGEILSFIIYLAEGTTCATQKRQ